MGNEENDFWETLCVLDELVSRDSHPIYMIMEPRTLNYELPNTTIS